MKNKANILAQAKSWLFLLVALCLSTLPFAGAQTDRQTEGSIPGVPPGYTIIEGDIQVPVALINLLQQKEPLEATFNTQLWPNGIIPFQFETTCAATSTCTNAPMSGCVLAANQMVMINAMAVLQMVANVNFQQCANNNCSGNYVHIRDSTNDTKVDSGNTCKDISRNNSPVGMQGGKQVINIVSWGFQFTIVHELLHALGFFHEQSRPDSDDYVDVTSLCSNVMGGCMGSNYTTNFPMASGATAYGYYDFDSVMHYGQCSFSMNPNCPNLSPAFPDGGITIRVKPPYNMQWQNAIGQRARLSDLDRATVSFLYPFANWRFLDCDYRGSNGASNGTFLRPYTSFATALANTPADGTIWILTNCTFQAAGTYSNRVTIRAAPGVIATLGG
jgi:hypothetical protein